MATCLVLVSFVGHILSPILGEFVKMINVGEDSSIPTWYSSLALMLCSVLLATIALARRVQHDRDVLYWGLLSVLFLYLAADEMPRLHKRASDVTVQPALKIIGHEPTGILSYPWIILYAPSVLLFASVYLRFWLRLPARTQLLFAISGILFVGGGMSVEALSALYIYLYDEGAC